MSDHLGTGKTGTESVKSAGNWIKRTNRYIGHFRITVRKCPVDISE